MKRFCSMAAIIILLLTAGCGGSSVKATGDTSAVQKVAVVSLSVSDWGGSVTMGSVGNTPVSSLISDTVSRMLVDTERQLSSKWQVTPVSSFVNSQGYRAQAVDKTLSVYVPVVNGKEMPIFTQVSKEIKGGVITPDKAKALCAALNVDSVVLIFSEWTSKTGGVIPMTKAVTKNIFTIWDANGRMIVKKRIDMMGSKPLGFSGFKAVNQDTIAEWEDTYSRSIARMLQSM